MRFIENSIAAYVRSVNRKYFAVQEGAAPLPEPAVEKKYLLYLHVPFCEELCSYCSFNRYKFEPETARKYFAALREELKLYKERGYDFCAAYVGGGTPTILMEELEATLQLAKQFYSIHEISVETNPNHLTEQNIAAMKRLGVNRLSVGVQSFDDELLKRIGRYDKYGSGQKIRESILAAQGKFETLNIDLIFNLPGQTLTSLGQDLETIVNLEIDQVTFYPLMATTDNTTIDYKKERLFYTVIQDKISPAFTPVSAWCFSRKKGMLDEYIVDYDEYIGIGSGSFSFVNGTILANTFSLSAYGEALQKKEPALCFSKKFTLKECMRYDFLMKLFALHLDLKPLEEKYLGKFYKYLWKEILFFKTIGVIEEKDNSFQLTRKGMYYWVIMMREFFQGVNNFRQQGLVFSRAENRNS